MKAGFNIILLFIFISLSSCDCIQEAKGIVVEEDTGLPLKGAKAYKISKPYLVVETGSLGEFHLTSVSGGIFNCPPMEIKIEKDGYEPQIVDFESDKEITVKLKKKNNGN